MLKNRFEVVTLDRGFGLGIAYIGITSETLNARYIVVTILNKIIRIYL